MKILRFVLVAFTSLILLGWLAFELFFRIPIPRMSGNEIIPGLSAQVEVRYDDYGVPHVLAQNEADLIFAQGYITARERMFQMDLNRRAGRGELSVLLGDITLDTDKFFRTTGFSRIAKEEYETLDPSLKAILESYTRGVNAYIHSVKVKPPEYILLGADIEEWQPEDSLLIGVLMAYSLTRSKDADLLLSAIAQKVDPDKLKDLLPIPPDGTPEVILGYQPASPGDIKDALSLLDSPYLLGYHASNFFVFSGQRTTTGKPLLAGSPDLEPKIPALFYLMHLKGGDFDVIGGSLPGLPFINVLGFNGYLAWSTTNGRADELDYFVERINPDNPDQYLTPNGWKDFKILNEQVLVKDKQAEGGFRQENLTIKISDHGPIVTDLVPLAPENTAMQWISSTGMMDTMYRLNKARGFDEFRQALSFLKSPSLNVAYADIDGNIGFQYAASLPIRKNGTGVLPAAGWTGESDWIDFVPFDQLPFVYNPENGYVASFNNKPTDTQYHISSFFMVERATRFNQIVESQDQFSPEDMLKMQFDSVSVVAERWVPMIHLACQNLQCPVESLELFDRWDFSIQRDSSAAALFNAFYSHLMENTFGDELGQELWDALERPYLVYIPDMAMIHLLEANTNPWLDNIDTPEVEDLNQIIALSLRQAADELTERIGKDPSSWSWGSIHRMTFKHPLGSRLSFFNLKPIPTDGDGFTINAGSWNNLNPYDMEAGGCIRLVVDFEDLEKSTFTSPPGQSGHWRSPHYDDLAVSWANGEQIPLHYMNPGSLRKVLILTPEER